MPMRDEHPVETFEAQPGLQDLPLGAFTAVDQEAVLVVYHHLGGETAVDGGGRSRGAEEEDFKQG